MNFGRDTVVVKQLSILESYSYKYIFDSSTIKTLNKGEN
jgi:hypothetical protein